MPPTPYLSTKPSTVANETDHALWTLFTLVYFCLATDTGHEMKESSLCQEFCPLATLHNFMYRCGYLYVAVCACVGKKNYMWRYSTYRELYVKHKYGNNKNRFSMFHSERIDTQLCWVCVQTHTDTIWFVWHKQLLHFIPRIMVNLSIRFWKILLNA